MKKKNSVWLTAYVMTNEMLREIAEQKENRKEDFCRYDVVNKYE